MAQPSFTAQIDSWITETKERTEAVVKESTQRVVSYMQTPRSAGGNMPVQTGFLRASIMAAVGAPLPIRPGHRPQEGQSYSPNNQVTVAIASMALGQTIYVTYTAEYARHVEYGAGGRPARAFVRLAAMQWTRIVGDVATTLKARAAR